jgi:hypothetical protein
LALIWRRARSRFNLLLPLPFLDIPMRDIMPHSHLPAHAAALGALRHL